MLIAAAIVWCGADLAHAASDIPGMEGAAPLVVMEAAPSDSDGIKVSVGQKDMKPWILVQDARRSVLWEKIIASDPYEYGSFSKVRRLGSDFLVAGTAAERAAILRLDGKGGVTWRQTLGDETHATADMSGPVDDTVFVAGGIGRGTQSARWAARVELAGGKIVWFRMLGDGASGHASRVDLLPNGDVLVSGSRAHGCFCEGFQASEPWAARLNAGGETLWEKNLGPGVAYPDTSEKEPKSSLRFEVEQVEHAGASVTLKGRAYAFKSAMNETPAGHWTVTLDGNGTVTAKSFVP